LNIAIHSLMKTESIEQFYLDKQRPIPEGLNKITGHMNVFRLEDCTHGPIHYARRDYYKVTLLKGHNRYHYADKSIEVNGVSLIFFNPQVPYTWEYLAPNPHGYFCIFTPGFFTEKSRIPLNELPMFAPGGKPAYTLNNIQDEAFSALFEKMLAEIDSDYPFKYDLLHSYLTEMIHLAMKTEANSTIYEHPSANTRITAVFRELLERQFPVETPSHKMNMRSAAEYADALSVHVNHLNRAIKATTGKTTSTLIGERLADEAKALLKHTDWNVAEIGNSLGFEEPSHFNNFFKKHTGETPRSFRIV
jgi:AraC family transcriptional regulator, transcriptional activator of pobA